MQLLARLSVKLSSKRGVAREIWGSWELQTGKLPKCGERRASPPQRHRRSECCIKHVVVVLAHRGSSIEIGPFLASRLFILIHPMP